MFERFGRLVPRLRWVFVVTWIAAAVFFGLFAPSLAKVGSADETSFLPANAESLSARHVIAQAFPGDAAPSQGQMVFSRPGGITDADRTYIDGLGSWLTKDAPDAVRSAVRRYVTVESNPELASSYRSGDGVVELARIDFSVASFQAEANDTIDAIRAHVAHTVPAGLTAQLTGQAGIGRDYLKAIQEGTDRTTIVTIVLVVLILLAIYRAPLAALVPLITIGAAFLVARGVLGFAAEAGWKLSTVLDSFIVVLVFGVGTDYTIFLISRFREELTKARFAEAIGTTIGRISAVIAASAATVIVGLGSMIVARFGMIQTTGPALAITVFVTLLAGLTLTPSLLALFGRRLFWPLHEQTREASDASRGVWAGVGSLITRRPAALAGAVLVALAVPLIGLPQLRQSFDVLSELPAGSEARAGFDTLSAHLGKGQLLPLTVLIRTPGGDQTSPAALGRLASLSERIAGIAGGDVATVRSLVQPAADGKTPVYMQPSAQLGQIATGLSLAGATTNPAVAIGDQSVASLQAAAAYFGALGPAFPDVASSSAFTGAKADFATLDGGVQTLRQQARVSTQLAGLAAQLETATAGGSAPDSSAIGGYLRELAAAYPDVTSTQPYRDAASALDRYQAGDRTTSRTQLIAALRALASAFESRPTAFLFPTSLPASAAAQQAQQQLAATRTKLAGELTALATAFGARPDDYFLPPATGTSATQLQQLVAAYDSPGRDVTRLYITTRSDPYAPEAFTTVRELRSLLAEQRPSFGTDAEVYLGGATAEFADIQTTISEDFINVALITIGGIFVVLVLLLRSLVAPMYLVLTVLLSYGTSLSLSALLLQNGFGQSGINYFIPLIVFVLLVALGSDYNIFLMARVREEAAARGVRAGIRVASARTGTVITSAGLILAGTFGALVTSPLQLLFQVGLAVALGVLIDTFVVRSLLVPAITALLGERSWWPSRSGAPALALAPAGGAAAIDGPDVAVAAKASEPVPAASSAPAVAPAVPRTALAATALDGGGAAAARAPVPPAVTAAAPVAGHVAGPVAGLAVRLLWTGAAAVGVVWLLRRLRRR